MKPEDGKLGDDLRAATGRDLPGEEFDERVMQTIEGGGGERVLSVGTGVSGWRGFRLAAAAVLLAVGVWAVSSGQFRRERAEAGGAAGPNPPADIELPQAETAEPWPEPIRIVVTHDGKVRILGRSVDLEGLRNSLVAETKGTHDTGRPSRPSERPMVLLADRQVRWRMVQWVLQACADPSVRLYKTHFATVGKDGELRVIPSFLPIDRGLVLRSKVTDELIDELVDEVRPEIEEEEVIEKEVIEDPVIEDDITDGPVEDEIIEEEMTGEGFILPGGGGARPNRKMRPARRPKIVLGLRREAGAQKTHYLLNGERFETRDECRRRLHRMLRADYLFNLEIDAGAAVPYGDVIFILDAYRRHGKGGVTFRGAPPPKGR
jgi:biopolymer transport protein ExbD